MNDNFKLVQNLFKTTKEKIQHLLITHWPAESFVKVTNRPLIKKDLSEKEQAKWQLIQEIQRAHQKGSSIRQLVKVI